ncbi:MAG: hypothetical protein DRJ97_07895 [Thermoprotei archaeon]|nr:MAG: hypothetical protein DRJ97_07895 [Thermoprotei archaeon]
MPVILKPWRKAVEVPDELIELLPEIVHQGDDRETFRRLVAYAYSFIPRKRLAAFLGIPEPTLKTWLKKLNIKLPRHRTWRDFKLPATDAVTKAIMWTFAHTDGSIKVRQHSVRIELGSPDPWLHHFFEEVFQPYAEVSKRPRGKVWTSVTYLPLEWYRWLLEPPSREMLEGSAFWWMVSVAVDTEGTIGVYGDEVRIEIRNEDRDFLELLRRQLKIGKIKATLYPEKEEGKTTNLGAFKHPLYVLIICKRYHCIRVLRCIKDKLQLPNKRALARLAYQHAIKGLSKYVDEELRTIKCDIKRIKEKYFELSRMAAESPPRPKS